MSAETMIDAVSDLKADIASATRAGSFDELVGYYSLDKHWKNDGLTAADVVEDVRSILASVQGWCEARAENDGLDPAAVPVLLAEREGLLEACKRQVENIEHWMETGIPATPEESRSIYEQLKAAIQKVTAASQAECDFCCAPATRIEQWDGPVPVCDNCHVPGTGE